MALRHLGRLYVGDYGDEVEIDGRFTHQQESAEMIGVSRQSVTTLLVCPEKAGDIRREGRRLFIPSEEFGTARGAGRPRRAPPEHGALGAGSREESKAGHVILEVSAASLEGC